jgi:uncharacterized membrane protein
MNEEFQEPAMNMTKAIYRSLGLMWATSVLSFIILTAIISNSGFSWLTIPIFMLIVCLLYISFDLLAKYHEIKTEETVHLENRISHLQEEREEQENVLDEYKTEIRNEILTLAQETFIQITNEFLKTPKETTEQTAVILGIAENSLKIETDRIQEITNKLTTELTNIPTKITEETTIEINNEISRIVETTLADNIDNLQIITIEKITDALQNTFKALRQSHIILMRDTFTELRDAMPSLQEPIRPQAANQHEEN